MRKHLLRFFLFGFCLLVGCRRIPSGSVDSFPDQSSTFAESSSILSSAEDSSVLSSDTESFIESQETVTSIAASSAAVTFQTLSSKETSSKRVSSKASSSPKSSAVSSSPKSSTTTSSSTVYPPAKPINGETKAVWISQFDLQNVLKQNGKQRDQASFTTLFGKMIDNIKSYGFNTIFLQARPYSDSFYPSEYFPWSNMVVSSFGQEASYDPYGIMVTEARKRGFSVHGWVNPLRGMTDAQLQQVDNRFPIKKWYNDSSKRGKNIVLDGGRWYYNSSVAEVRELIADGAKELLKKYGLDGIHIDDYFYYSSSLDDVSKMIKGLYDAVKSVNPNAQFGVAPEGNIERDYSVHFADVRKWCAEKGYIDYICPQIYYGMEHATHDFAKVVAQWNSLISEKSGVYLLAGMTLGKAGNEDQFAGVSGKKEWQQHNDILKRSIIETRKQSNAAGFSIFCYQYLFDPLTGAKVSRTSGEVNNFLPELRK